MLLSRFKREFFHWLYHPMAFAYDLVAAVVSLGQWTDWGFHALAYVEGPRVLELGHGPGHQLLNLHAGGYCVIGLDESRQMSRLSRRRLGKEGISNINLITGLAQSVPFPDASFDTLISIFPSEYIFDGRTLAEARRVLAPNGKLVVLPVAWPGNLALKWLFRITGESPSTALEHLVPKIKQTFLEAGFYAAIQILHTDSGTLMILIATPSER